MPKWLSIVWVLLPKKYIGRLVLDGLIYLATKTKTKADDEFLRNAEEWLIKEGAIDPKVAEKIKAKHSESSTNNRKSQEKE